MFTSKYFIAAKLQAREQIVLNLTDQQSLLEVGIEYCVAGASLSATCSMCQAGTYWSGSGEEIVCEHLPCT